MTAIFYYAVFYPAIELLAALAVGPHPALRGRRGAARRPHPRRAGGLHPVLRALLAADLRPLREVQHPAGGHGRPRSGSSCCSTPGPTCRRSPGAGAPPRGARAGWRSRTCGSRYAAPAPERVRPTADPQWVLRDIDVRGGARQERRPGGRHRRRQDLDHQPAHPLLRRAAGPGDPRRRRTSATSTPAPCAASLALVLQDVYLFSGTIASNIRLGSDDLRRAGARRPRAPSTPTASSRPCPRATTPRSASAGRTALGGPEAAPLLRPRARPRPAGADPGRGHLVGGHRDRAAHPGGPRDAPAGPHRDRDRPPAVHHPERRRDPGAAQGPHPRARHPPASCCARAASTGGSTSSSTRTRSCARRLLRADTPGKDHHRQGKEQTEKCTSETLAVHAGGSPDRATGSTCPSNPALNDFSAVAR